MSTLSLSDEILLDVGARPRKPGQLPLQDLTLNEELNRVRARTKQTLTL